MNTQPYGIQIRTVNFLRDLILFLLPDANLHCPTYFNNVLLVSWTLMLLGIQEDFKLGNIF